MDRLIERVFDAMPIPIRVVIVWLVLMVAVFWLMPIGQSLLRNL